MKNLILLLSFLYSLTSANAQSTTEITEEKIYVAVQEKAFPYEGYEEFGKAFSENLNVSNRKFNVDKFMLIIQFVIEKDGSFTNINLKNDEYHLIKEVKRVFSLLPKWKPAIHNGEKVRSRYTVPITINVNTSKSKEMQSDFEHKNIE